MVVFGRGRCIPATLLYSVKVVVFGQKWLYWGKGGCIRAKVVAFRQNGLYSRKVVLFGPKGLYSRKSGCIRVK